MLDLLYIIRQYSHIVHRYVSHLKFYLLLWPIHVPPAIIWPLKTCDSWINGQRIRLIQSILFSKTVPKYDLTEAAQKLVVKRRFQPNFPCE